MGWNREKKRLKISRHCPFNFLKNRGYCCCEFLGCAAVVAESAAANAIAVGASADYADASCVADGVGTGAVHIIAGVL